MSLNTYKSLLKSFVPMFVIGFVFCLASVPDASGQGILNEILARMEEHNKSLTSLKANVTMEKVNAQLGGVKDTMEGSAAYLPQRGKDALIRIDWKNPKESLAVVNKQYVIYRPGLNQAYTGSTNDAQKNPKAGNALSFMSMSRAQLRQNYNIVYLGQEAVGGGQTWHLQLTPKTRSSYQLAEIWVDGNGMPIRSKILEHNKDSTTVTLSGLQKNVKINGDEFKISLPKTTKIIKA